jgi:transcriptional regulator GlxA family with amidase domain
VVVPAPNARQPAGLIETLGRRDVRKAMACLRTWKAEGAGIAAACIGTFVLAEAGLLDEGEATTSWSLAPFFRQRYPAIKLDDSRMIVVSHGVVTAGAMMGHLDLALWLVRQASPELAALVARFVLIDKRSSQAEYIIPDHLARIERAQHLVSMGHDLESIASEVGYADSATLRALLRRKLGRGVREIRADMR